MRAVAYRIEFSREARKHFSALNAHQRVLEDQEIVHVQAIGVKIRNRVLVGGKEIEL